jgi:hypothetical protein
VNKGLALLAVVFTIALAVAADRIYGAFGMPETTNLLFPAFSRAHHQSTEFDVTVHINNLGFRENMLPSRKRKSGWWFWAIPSPLVGECRCTKRGFNCCKSATPILNF